MAKDYANYNSKLNITFVGINTDATSSESRLKGQIKENHYVPFAHLWEPTGFLAAAYGVSPTYPCTIVVVDADGVIAGSDGSLGELLPKAKGILSGINVPTGCEQAAHLFNLQQFDLMDAELAKRPPQEIKAFKEALKAKVTAYTAKRATELTALSDSNPLIAFREDMAFLKAFGKAAEASAVKNLYNKLLNAPKVKKEIDAESSYKQIVAPAMAKAQSLAAYNKTVQPLMNGYMQKYGDTEYAQVVKGIADAALKKMPK